MKIENLEKAKEFYEVVEFLKKYRTEQINFLLSDKYPIKYLSSQDEFVKSVLSDLRIGIIDLENKLLEKIEQKILDL